MFPTSPSIRTLASLFLTLPAALAWAGGCQGSAQFPEQVAVSDGDREVSLDKTGEAERHKFFFHVYNMAHYSESPCESDNLLSDGETRSIRIEFSRDISCDRIRDDFWSTMRDRHSRAEMALIAPTLEEFCAPIQGEVKEGDDFELVWWPGGRIVSYFNGRELSRVENEAFARALWAIWFGEDSVVDRNDLLALVPSAQDRG